MYFAFVWTLQMMRSRDGRGVLIFKITSLTFYWNDDIALFEPIEVFEIPVCNGIGDVLDSNLTDIYSQ